MNICILTPFYNEYPNAMASAEKMATALARHNNVTVVTSKTYKAKAEETKNGVEIIRLPAWYIPEPANYVFTRGLLRYIWKHRKSIDVFVINKYMWPVSWSIIFLKLLRKPTIVCVDAFQGFDWWSWSALVNAIMWLYARTFGLLVLLLADRVVIFHEGLEERARQLHLRYQIIHNGIDPQQFKNVIPAADTIGKPNEVIITYIGRLDKIKGYLDFLSVAQQISQGRTDVKFYVVGNTHERNNLVQQYQSDHIIFTNVRLDVPNILKASDLLVLPTYGDGLPNVIMEAMAAGLPTIGTNINGIPYLIDNHYTGILIEPGDLAAMKRAILTLINNPEMRKQYGAAARKKVLAEFNWNTISQQYMNLFRTLQ